MLVKKFHYIYFTQNGVVALASPTPDKPYALALWFCKVLLFYGIQCLVILLPVFAGYGFF